jgi:hypothetical protein
MAIFWDSNCVWFSNGSNKMAANKIAQLFKYRAKLSGFQVVSCLDHLKTRKNRSVFQMVVPF